MTTAIKTEEVLNHIDYYHENEQEREKEFILSTFLEEQGVKPADQKTNFERKKSFRDICKTVKDHLEKLHGVDSHSVNEIKPESSGPSQDKLRWIDYTHRAVSGYQDAINYVMNEVEGALNTLNLANSEYPNDTFNSLPEAVFHMVWGRKYVQKYFNTPESEACMIVNNEIWIDEDGQFIKQEEGFESHEEVRELIRGFEADNGNALLSEEHPELEIPYADGSRITILGPPRTESNNYIIMFRRFTVKNFSLEEQANKDTIDPNDVELFRVMSRLMLNTFIVGRVRSAKTTFMKTMIQERSPKYVIASLEKHFELALKAHMPDRLFAEAQAHEGEVEKVFPIMLRLEHDYVVVGECRVKEFEGAMIACERGERGMFSTYHLTHTRNIVRQIARHLCDQFSNRKIEHEEERVAQNIDVVIKMNTSRNRKHKFVESVSEVVWDYENKTHFTRDWIRYNKRKGCYQYNAQISEDLFELMDEEDPDLADRFKEMLEKRQDKSPLEGVV